MPPQLETGRLLLRPFTENDIEAAFELLESHPDVYRFDPGFARTGDQRANIVRRHAADNQEDGEGTLAVVLKATGQLIGQVGLQLYILPWTPFATPEIELYYKFGRTFWDKGYGREACQEMLRFGFDDMRLLRVITVTQPDNWRSLRLLRRLGFCIAPAPEKWANNVIGVRINPACGAD